MIVQLKGATRSERYDWPGWPGVTSEKQNFNALVQRIKALSGHIVGREGQTVQPQPCHLVSHNFANDTAHQRRACKLFGQRCPDS